MSCTLAQLAQRLDDPDKVQNNNPPIVDAFRVVNNWPRVSMSNLQVPVFTFSLVTSEAQRWKPPKLLPTLPSDPHSTWMGAVDKYELVKALRQGVNRLGKRLCDEEIEYAVEAVELAEQRSVMEDFSGAFALYVDLVRRFPQFMLGYYKLGLLLCTIHAAEKRPMFHSNGDPNEFVENVVMQDLACYFGCAVALEPWNRVLKVNIDLILCVICGIPTNKDVWDVAMYPKSTADALCFTQLLA